MDRKPCWRTQPDDAVPRLTCQRRVLCCVFTGAVFLLTGAADGADQQDKDGDETANQAPTESLVVALEDGAASPREAVSAFVAAANAGDVDASLLLLDPEVRPLIRAEVQLEEYLLETHLLRNLVMNEQERKSPLNNLGAIPPVHGKRDLLRTRHMEVVGERESTIRDECVLLEVDWRVWSFHPTRDDRFDDVSITILAVRRDERWYLFHPFGTLLTALRESTGSAPQDDEKAVVHFDRREQPDAERRRARFVVSYDVPLEIVHREFVAAARSPEVAQLVSEAQQLLRFKNGIRNRLIRGEFDSLSDLDTALAEGEQAFENLLFRYGSSLKGPLDRLVENLTNGTD